METKIDKTLKEFMNVTAKTTVAVIVPLYGFWGDIPNNPVNGEVLKLALSRLYSNIHQLYLIFVAHPDSLPHEPNNSSSVTNVLLKWNMGGNAKNLPVSRDASYPEYISEGMDYALKETTAQFVVVFNPWVMIQEGGIDILIDRSNRNDDAKLVAGYDVRSIIDPESFDLYNNTMPIEEYDVSCNFMVMPRYLAEMVELDPNYKTHAFMERDIWQQVMIKNFVPISSQRVPIFPFDFPWQDYESKERFNYDKAYFAKKWSFDPGILYQDTRGIYRKDKAGAR
jgi:hypothetical protein